MGVLLLLGFALRGNITRCSTMATSKRERPLHGSKGLFVGGDWIPIEECADKFYINNGSGGDCSKSAPLPSGQGQEEARQSKMEAMISR